MTLPLAGYRIIELGEVWAGPVTGSMLADMGAEVVKIETVTRVAAMVRGSLTPPRPRLGYPDREPGERPWERFHQFNGVERNKRAITLDLRTPAGFDLFRKLVMVSDALLSNYTGGVLERLGVDYPRLKAIREDIILVHMGAFGATGPYRDYLAVGAVIDGVAGHTLLRGYPDSTPIGTDHRFPSDAMAPPHGALALLLALNHRRKTGRGQFVDLSQAETVSSAVGPAFMDYFLNGRIAHSVGNRDPVHAPYGVYPCQGDDRWVAIAVRDEAEWQALCRAMERPELAGDPCFRSVLDRRANHDALDAIIGAWTAEQSVEQVAALLRSSGVPVGPVWWDADVYADEHVRERGFLQEVTHPVAGTHRYPGPVFRMSNADISIRRPANTLGQHNQEVLGALLGLSDAGLAGLERDKVIGTTYLPGVGTRR